MGMSEIFRGCAEHNAGLPSWRVVSEGITNLDETQPLLNAIDDYIMEHPGFRVTISIERDGGVSEIPSSADLLAGEAGV